MHKWSQQGALDVQTPVSSGKPYGRIHATAVHAMQRTKISQVMCLVLMGPIETIHFIWGFSFSGCSAQGLHVSNKESRRKMQEKELAGSFS